MSKNDVCQLCVTANTTAPCCVAFSVLFKMKHPFRPEVLVVFLVLASMALLSNSSGVAHQQNKDRTGAPGSDIPCQQCHGGGNYVPTVQAFLVVDGDTEVLDYVPGAVHTLVVNVNSSGNPAGYGIQGTILLADNNNAGELVDQNSTDCIWLDEVEGRHIFEQNDLCASGVFEVEWIAPPAGSGPVSVYVSAIAVNGNSTSSGDVYEGAQFQFNEGVVGVEEFRGEWVRLSRNVKGKLGLNLDTPVRCSVFGADGRVLFDDPMAAGEYQLQLQTGGWVVVRCMTSAGATFTQRIWMNP